LKPRDHTYRNDALPEDLRRSLEKMDPAEARALVEAWEAAGSRLRVVRPVETESSGKHRVRAHVLSSIGAAYRPASGPMPAQPALRLVRSTRFISIAAAMLALVVVSFLLSPDVTSYRAPEGSVSGVNVDLPDGSSVTLSPGSRLYLTDAFGEEHRDVHLHGNAFFDVERESTSFTIRTFDARTTVLGTSFDVQAWPSAVEAETAVHVLSGNVRVTEITSNTSVTLSPGESGSTHANSSGEPITVDPSGDVQRAVAWRTGGFSFENEPVGDVISEINRRFDIRVRAPASIRLRRISYWKQSVESPDEIMSDIAATIGVRYRRTANGFSLYLTD